MLVRNNAGIDGPADLKGRRIGVPEYVQTAALWSRGVLENEFGIAPRDMTFFMERVPERSHAGAIGFVAPPGSHHQPDSAGEEHRLHDARGRAGCLHGGFNLTWPRYDRSKRR